VHDDKEELTGGLPITVSPDHRAPEKYLLLSFLRDTAQIMRMTHTRRYYKTLRFGVNKLKSYVCHSCPFVLYYMRHDASLSWVAYRHPTRRQNLALPRDYDGVTLDSTAVQCSKIRLKEENWRFRRFFKKLVEAHQTRRRSSENWEY
jgi:hypothetical protein